MKIQVTVIQDLVFIFVTNKEVCTTDMLSQQKQKYTSSLKRTRWATSFKNVSWVYADSIRAV